MATTTAYSSFSTTRKATLLEEAQLVPPPYRLVVILLLLLLLLFEEWQKKAFRNLFIYGFAGKAEKYCPEPLASSILVHSYPPSPPPYDLPRKKRSKSIRDLASWRNLANQMLGGSPRHARCARGFGFTPASLCFIKMSVTRLSARENGPDCKQENPLPSPGGHRDRKRRWRGSFFYWETPPTWPWWRLSGNIWG